MYVSNHMDVMSALLVSCLSLLSVAVCEELDSTFIQFCRNPPNHGTSTFFKGACMLTYDINTTSIQEAAKLCDIVHPFTLESYHRSDSTVTCVIKSHYKCESTEILIGNKCFLPRLPKTFTKEGDCGRSHRFHKVSGKFEQKWIAAFLSEYKVLWIANTREDKINVKIVEFPGEVLADAEGQFIPGTSNNMVIITSRGLPRRLTAGSLTFMARSAEAYLLCSRGANVLESYHDAISAKLKETGINSYVRKDRFNRMRSFVVLRHYSIYDMRDKYDVALDTIHRNCQSFFNGYAASPLDFDRLKDFASILREEDVNMVAVPGRKKPGSMSDSYECYRGPIGELNNKPKRTTFEISLPNGEYQTIDNPGMWKSYSPENKCADTPQVALAFTQTGLSDVPALARMLTVCAYGQPYPVDKSKQEASCSIYARFDSNKKECICNNPEKDIRTTTMIHLTQEERNVKPGTICVECEAYHEQNPMLIYDATNINLEDVYVITSYIFLPLLQMKCYGDVIGFGQYNVTIHISLKFDIKNYRETWDSMKEKIASNHKKNQNNRKSGYCGSALREAARTINIHPKHKRTLLLITVDFSHEDEVLQMLDQLRQKNAKIMIIAVNQGDADLSKFVKGKEKIFKITTTSPNYRRELAKAATHFDQILVRNICLDNQYSYDY